MFPANDDVTLVRIVPVGSEVAGLILEFDADPLPQTGLSADAALSLTIGKSWLDDFDDVAKLTADHSKHKNDTLLIYGSML